MSAQMKQVPAYEDFDKGRPRIEVFSATKYEAPSSYQPKAYQNTVMTPVVKKDYEQPSFERSRPLIDPITKYPVEDTLPAQ
jgi:hypothetical protein